MESEGKNFVSEPALGTGEVVSETVNPGRLDDEIVSGWRPGSDCTLEDRMKALVKLLLVVFGLTASVRVQESSPTPSTVDEPALPNSKLEIPHPPSMALLPESGALPDPTPSPTSGIYSPLKTKNMVVTKPPLRPKRSRRWKPKRKSASRSSDRSPCGTITESDDARLSAPPEIRHRQRTDGIRFDWTNTASPNQELMRLERQGSLA